MKKIYSILMLAMMAMCVLTLSSCGDDDEEVFSPKSIIGTWRETDTYGSSKWVFEITFKKDNTFHWRETEYEDGKIIDDDKDSGKYYINGSNVLLDFGEGDEDTWEIMYFDGKTMKVRWNGDNDLDTFYKV